MCHLISVFILTQEEHVGISLDRGPIDWKHEGLTDLLGQSGAHFDQTLIIRTLQHDFQKASKQTCASLINLEKLYRSLELLSELP